MIVLGIILLIVGYWLLPRFLPETLARAGSCVDFFGLVVFGGWDCVADFGCVRW